MNHEKRRDVVEAIGLVAIVASLVFVAWELREVNIASKIAARDSITEGHLEFMGSLIDETVLPVAIWKLESSPEDLSQYEHFQIEMHHQRRWRHYERVYYMYKFGVLTDQEWKGFRAALHDSMNDDSPWSATSRSSWEGLSRILSEEFVRYVESLREVEE